jgi:type IV secretion system protein VirD4
MHNAGVSKTQVIGTGVRPLLLGSFGLIVGATRLSALATQFVDHRVGYHPAIGAPLFGHIYALH